MKRNQYLENVGRLQIFSTIEAAVKLLSAAALSQIGCICLFATSAVEIRHEGLTRPEEDCLSEDETVRVVRIEAAVFGDDGQEIRRAPIRTCLKSKSNKEEWVFTLDEDGSVLKRERNVTRLGDHGRVIEYAVYTWADGKMSSTRYETTYDSQGRVLQTQTVDEEGSADTLQYVLDERGDPVVTTNIDSEGEINYVTRSRYDDKHHLLFERTDGEGGDTTSFKYDDRGRLIERISGRSETRTVFRYEYDEEGRPISYRQIYGSSPERTWTGGYSYWPGGLIKEEWQLHQQGLPTKYSSYAYDDYKHYRQEWIYTRALKDEPENFVLIVDGHVRTFGQSNGLPVITYTYDAHGNWVKAIETRLSSPAHPGSEREVTSIIYRQIEYR